MSEIIDLTDKATIHAHNVRHALSALNAALERAADAGIRIDIDVHTARRPDGYVRRFLRESFIGRAL